MSSILKALEKVEGTHGSRRSVGASGLGGPHVPRPAWVLPAGVFGGAAVAALLTFAAMGGFNRSVVSPQQAKAVVKPVSPVALPVAPRIVTHTAKPAPNPPIIPVVSAAALNIKTSTGSKVHTPNPRPVKTVKVARSTSVPTSPVIQSVAPQRMRPEIRVTGIAWQKESASSAAIVNGTPVEPGGMVDGYKVEEIFQDKVRFSHSNATLDVPLGGGE